MDESQYEALAQKIDALRGESVNGTKISLAVLDTKLNQVIQDRHNDKQRVDDLERCRLDDVQRVTRLEGRVSNMAVGQSILSVIGSILAAAFGASK